MSRLQREPVETLFKLVIIACGALAVISLLNLIETIVRAMGH